MGKLNFPCQYKKANPFLPKCQFYGLAFHPRSWNNGLSNDFPNSSNHDFEPSIFQNV